MVGKSQSFGDTQLRLKGYVARRIQDNDLRDDIVQEANLRLLAYQSSKRGDIANITAFLCQISLNLIRDHFRLLDKNKVESIDDTIACTAPSPHQYLEQKELISFISKTIERMPKLRQQVFILRRIHGMSASDVAARLNLSRSAVSNHVARALTDLDNAIEQFEKRKHF